MSAIGKPERATQNRVIALLRDELGHGHPDNWGDRDSNSKFEEGLLSAWLAKKVSQLIPGMLQELRIWKICLT